MQRACTCCLLLALVDLREQRREDRLGQQLLFRNGGLRGKGRHEARGDTWSRFRTKRNTTCIRNPRRKTLMRPLHSPGRKPDHYYYYPSYHHAADPGRATPYGTRPHRATGPRHIPLTSTLCIRRCLATTQPVQRCPLHRAPHHQRPHPPPPGWLRRPPLTSLPHGVHQAPTRPPTRPPAAFTLPLYSLPTASSPLSPPAWRRTPPRSP